METTAIPNEYVTAAEVPVEEEVPIPDVYEALLEQERLGTLEIIRWEAVSEKTRDWIIRVHTEEILEASLLGQDVPIARYMRERYPESWAAAQKEDGK